MSVHFTGPFAPICEQFVAGKRLLGIDYTQQEKILRRLIILVRHILWIHLL